MKDKPIKFKYDGIEFNSWPEAKFAQFLDLRGIKWKYDPESPNQDKAGTKAKKNN